MKIKSFKIKSEIDGIKPFSYDSLGNTVILTGKNGSGKTRFLKLLCNHLTSLNHNDLLEFYYVSNDEKEILYNNIGLIKIANYSHYDAILQSAKKFSPYVIGKAKDLLLECNYEETALNALLVIQDMAYGYSEEFKDGKRFLEFKQFLLDNFDIILDKGDTNITVFDRDIESAQLSPGQLYLLRIAVACFFNEKKDNLLFVLDEPELHLHPKAMIKMLEKLREFFPNSQFWISTHSLELISYTVCVESSTIVLCFEHGCITPLRSNPNDIIEGLLGHGDNLAFIQRFYNLPDEYACIQFALECFNEAETKSGKHGDPQQEIISEVLKSGGTIVDYGAGQGRLLEQISLDTPELLTKISYYAFNIPSCNDISKCLEIMSENKIDCKNHFTDVHSLESHLYQKTDKVFLVNVLHEIEPTEWSDVFLVIYNLLKENGKLYIVERDILTVGESPYECGFLMLTSNAAIKLFGNCEEKRHPKKNYIVRYTIERENLAHIGNQKIKDSVETIKQDAINEIRSLKSLGTTKVQKERYNRGMKLSFWLNQYANASLILENFDI